MFFSKVPVSSCMSPRFRSAVLLSNRRLRKAVITCMLCAERCLRARNRYTVSQGLIGIRLIHCLIAYMCYFRFQYRSHIATSCLPKATSVHKKHKHGLHTTRYYLFGAISKILATKLRTVVRNGNQVPATT